MSECDIYTFDGIEYNDDIISFNDIEVVDDTVCGCMATIIKDDTYVMGRIESYPYDGDENMNHVPIVTVVDYNGSIIAEPHIRDSTNMKTAYKNLINGIETAYQEYCVDN